MMVALCGQDSVRLCVRLSSRIGKKTNHTWRHGHALDKNEYTYPSMAVSETHFHQTRFFNV